MKKIDVYGIKENAALDVAKEAITLASLSHPNILKYYDSFRDTTVDSNFFCIITEFCDVFYKYIFAYLKSNFKI